MNIEVLLSRLNSLKQRVATLEDENALLKKENLELRKENERLRTENTSHFPSSLKERLSFFENPKNSRNSSIPPTPSRDERIVLNPIKVCENPLEKSLGDNWVVREKP